MRTHTFFFWILFLLALVGTRQAGAQNINGEKIQVAADALTVLRFNSEIKRYELGNRDGYTCQVRGNDNSIVIKTISDNPASTNLVVTEGKRTHYFVIVFLNKIDLNNTQLYYDYSDMKTLRRLAGGGTEAAADKDESDTEDKKSKKQLKKEEREREEIEKREREAIAARARDEELRKQQAEQHRKDSVANVQRLKDEKVAKAKEKKDAEARQKDLARLDQQEKDAEKKRLKAEKDEKDRLAKINAIADAKERERQRQLQQQEVAARAAADAKERKQLKEEKDKKEKEAALALQTQKDAEAKRLKDERDAKAKQDKEAAAARAQAEADARIANPYYRNPLFRKYPQVNFAEPPEGQRLTGEYFLPDDTMRNYDAAMQVMGEKPRLANTTVTANGITITIQTISFSSVNAYFSVHVKNGSAKDFLVGPMMLDWKKGRGGSFKLWAAYVTEYPVLPPGGETNIIFAARAVNASDADNFVFSLSNRLTGATMEIPFAGKLYNAEMDR